MGVLIEQLRAKETPSTKKVDYVHATVGGSFMSYDQLVELLSYIPTSDTVERVNLVSRCFHRLSNVDDPRKALNLLVGEERAMAEKQLGTASFAFFKNNATGFHRLDLSKHAHRDVASRLVGLYNAMDQEVEAISAYFDGRAGGKRDLTGIGLIWRNSKLDGVPFTFTPYWSIPYSGTLEVDFVDIRRPPPTAEAMSDETFKDEVLDKWDQKSSLLGLDLVSPSNKLKILREVSNAHYFNCTITLQSPKASVPPPNPPNFLPLVHSDAVCCVCSLCAEARRRSSRSSDRASSRQVQVGQASQRAHRNRHHLLVANRRLARTRQHPAGLTTKRIECSLTVAFRRRTLPDTRALAGADAV